MRLVWMATTCSVVMLVSSSAVVSAATGTATGTLRYYDALEGSCVPVVGNNYCDGAKFPSSQTNAMRPVANTLVTIRDNIGAIIGTGVTDDNGVFSVGWNSGLFAPSSISVVWSLDHKDGRFQIRNSLGGYYLMRTSSKLPVIGGITDFGVPTWGTSATPNDLANLYAAAERLWRHSLSQSARLQAYFTHQETNFPAWYEPFGWDAGSDGQSVWLTSNRVYDLTIMHEYGHVADMKSYRDQSHLMTVFGEEYNYVPPSGDPQVWPWDALSLEYRQAQLGEAKADFFKAVALYYPWARDPYLHYNMETAANKCTLYQQDRMQMTALRILWDYYDSRQDTEVISGTNYTDLVYLSGMSAIVEATFAHPNGTGSHRKDEGWSCGIVGCTLTNPDANNIWDLTYWLGNTSALWNVNRMNCHASPQ